MKDGKDPARELLRHTVATLAYRAGKAIRGVPDGFGDFRTGEKTRTPREILAHLADLMEWAHSIARGEERWSDAAPFPWDQEVARFYEALARFDSHLASSEPLRASVEKLFQGPVADAFTHVRQISLLRRLAGGPVRGENYFKADIAAGRVGREQSAPRREFD